MFHLFHPFDYLTNTLSRLTSNCPAFALNVQSRVFLVDSFPDTGLLLPMPKSALLPLFQLL